MSDLDNQSMTFEEYQEQSAKFDIYPVKYRLHSYALGLCGEAGEVANKIKKLYRGDTEHSGPGELAKELGDCLWYLTQLASYLGFSVTEIANMNLDKLEDRKKRNQLRGSGDNR